MIKELRLPEIAENVETATVLTLLVSVGDKIKKDQNVAEMESDKATFDLPSEISGKVKEIKVKEGEEVKVGDVVMTIESGDEEEGQESKDESQEKKEEEDQESGVESQEKKEKETKEKEKKEEEGQEPEDESQEEEEKEEKEEEDQESRDKSLEEDEKEQSEEKKEKEEEEHAKAREREKEVPASPSVRRLARELGVDIYKVEGTGPGDRITADDVKSFAKEAVKRSDHKGIAADYDMPDFSVYGETERQPLDSIRKRIARNMQSSWQEIPHVFHFDNADVTQLESFRKKYAKEVEKEGGKLTVTAILLKVTSKALQAFPKFNASLDMKNEEVIYKKYVNIGVAVDTERGLMVPVIRDVDKKSIVELSVELGELAEAARNKKIKPDQLQGGNLAISNLGGIGGTNFTPIIYRPNVAILGVSRTTTEPVFIDGEFKPRKILPLSLSYDHRLIDGAEAARFMRWLCESLENPLLTMFKEGK